MKTKIFTYKGHIGAETDLEKGKFINNPRGEGQMGCVIDVKEIDITKRTLLISLKMLNEKVEASPQLC